MKALSMKTFTRCLCTSWFMIFCHLSVLANGYEQKQIMDNERVRILIVTCPPGAESPSVVRTQDRVVYALEGGTIQRNYANGQDSIIEYKKGDVFFSNSPEDKLQYAIKNIGATTVILQVIYLK